MKGLVIKIIKAIIPPQWIKKALYYRNLMKRYPNVSLIKLIRKGQIVLCSTKMDYRDDYLRQLKLIVEKMRIKEEFGYIYPYDSFISREVARTPICSITVDFEKVLDTSFLLLKEQVGMVSNSNFKDRELGAICCLERLADRIACYCRNKKTGRGDELYKYFTTMLNERPQSLDEGLQKILFFDALFWQMGHFHIGLGRMDLILYKYYEADIQKGVLSREKARDLIRNFILALGNDTVSKSPSLKGDTGQYILLGGIDDGGKNVENELTRIFIDLLAELKIPDPKLILRINENTSMEIWEKSVDCIMTGIGSPLLMNEKIIIDKMEKFGYNASDVWNVGTSACWEPLIIGKSFDQNNPFNSAAAIIPLNKVIFSGNDYQSFDSLLEAYKKEYKKELRSVVIDIDFDCSPLFTLFFDECIKNEKDFTAGGATYAYHGAQVVSFPNTINALLNIKRFVYEEKRFTLAECRDAIEKNYEGYEDLRTLLLANENKFGSTNNEVLTLTNDLIHYTGTVIDELRCNGQRVKVGFSSPNYVYKGKIVGASLDGRKNGDPFAVHISPITSKIDIMEILDFSTKLRYDDNCINGNVVDFILPSSYVKQKDKLVNILKNACSSGLFELQLNVMDKATLVDAKAHPEKYPNLIVRVWGFSAYFNDLPEEFKDNLIRRAEIYEAA